MCQGLFLCFKLIGYMEFFRETKNNHRVNTQLLNDLFKSVFVIEDEVPNEHGHFLCCSAAVMRPSGATHCVFIVFLIRVRI